MGPFEDICLMEHGDIPLPCLPGSIVPSMNGLAQRSWVLQCRWKCPGWRCPVFFFWDETLLEMVGSGIQHSCKLVLLAKRKSIILMLFTRKDGEFSHGDVFVYSRDLQGNWLSYSCIPKVSKSHNWRFVRILFFVSKETKFQYNILLKKSNEGLSLSSSPPTLGRFTNIIYIYIYIHIYIYMLLMTPWNSLRPNEGPLKWGGIPQNDNDLGSQAEESILFGA